MSEECKYCGYNKKCLENAEHGSLYCMIHKRVPKVIGITYEELQQENKELKQRFYKAIHEIQLIQMDGEVSVRDITKLVGTLRGDK